MPQRRLDNSFSALLWTSPTFCCVLFSGLWLMCIGCDDGRPVLVEASGQVLFLNQPLTAGSISLIPEPGNAFQGDSPSSQLQLDGRFTMKTFPWGAGVTPGNYTVTLSSELAGRIQRPNYAIAEKSPLKVTVPPEGSTDLQILIR